eukprot:gene6836-4965_t
MLRYASSAACPPNANVRRPQHQQQDEAADAVDGTAAVWLMSVIAYMK